MSGKKEKKLRIVDHRHCKICGRTILPNQEFCSEKCRKIHEEMTNREKKMRRILLILYGIMIVALVVLLALRSAAY